MCVESRCGLPAGAVGSLAQTSNEAKMSGTNDYDEASGANNGVNTTDLDESDLEQVLNQTGRAGGAGAKLAADPYP